MMRRSMKAALVAVMIAVPVSGVQASELLRDGKYTLDVSIPNSGSAWVGGRKFVDADTAIEASVNLLLQTETDNGALGGTKIGVMAGYMKYFSHGRVSPYMRYGGKVELYLGDRYENSDSLLWGYAGVGAEYMVTKELSIRASVNAGVQLTPDFIADTFSNDLLLSFYF